MAPLLSRLTAKAPGKAGDLSQAAGPLSPTGETWMTVPAPSSALIAEAIWEVNQQPGLCLSPSLLNIF